MTTRALVPERGGTLGQESAIVERGIRAWFARPWFAAEPEPTVDERIARNLRLAQQALDAADKLKFNSRGDNRAIIEQVVELLGTEDGAE